ncbi:MAG: hypothetical protein HIU82_15315 [Proteobacteria bacterium]|nr:hypothetical protein [Pseudomonadota bacterium]
MSPITVTPLAAEQIDSAYPLVREVAPELTATAWRRYARRAIGAAGGRAGILAARREARPFPCGLVCYRKDEDLARGAVLVASHFIAMDILDPHPVLAALVAELEALAPRLGCTSVHAAVADHAAELDVVLAHAGHRRVGHTVSKTTGRQAG